MERQLKRGCDSEFEIQMLSSGLLIRKSDMYMFPNFISFEKLIC